MTEEEQRKREEKTIELLLREAELQAWQRDINAGHYRVGPGPVYFPELAKLACDSEMRAHGIDPSQLAYIDDPDPEC